MRRRRQALTLFELMLVLAVLGALAAIAYPSLEAMYGGFRVTAAADAVRAAWADARSHAIDEGRPYRFSILPQHGNYRVAPDSGQYWGGSGGQPAADEPGGYVLEQALPKTIRFRSANDPPGVETGGESSLEVGAVQPGSWTTVVTFLPDGTASDDVELVFQGPGTRPLAVRLRGLTGVVTTRQLAP